MKVVILVAAVAGLAGGLIGAATYAVLDNDASFERGSIIRFGHIGSFYEIEDTPFCVELQHFCLVQLDSGEVRALYTYDTHQWSRERNCEIRWLPDFAFVDPDTQENTTGWFRADCSGTTYRYSGEQVFGPGPRDMDRFGVKEKFSLEETPDGDELRIDYLEVDTRRLICGEVVNSTAPEAVIGRLCHSSTIAI